MGSSLSTVTRHSLRFKLFLTFSVLTLVICTTISSLYALREIRSYRQRTIEKSQILATSLATAVRLPLFSEDQAALARAAAETAGYAGVRSVTITNTAGVVLAQAGPPQAPNRREAISRDAVVMPGPQALSADEVMGLYAGNDTPLGRINVTMDDAELTAFIRTLAATSILTALFFWVVVSYLSFLVVQWVTRSLTPLIVGIRAMRGGDYAARIIPAGHDELAEAAAAVNELAKALQTREAENEQLQQKLVEAMRMEVREERRKMMAKLIQTNRMTSLGLLVAGMAHEINTPNGAIKLAGQQVARTWRDTVPILDRVVTEEGDFMLGGMEYSLAREEIGKASEVIVRSAERIDRVVKDLRNYNLGEQGAARNQGVDVNQVVVEALEIVRAQGSNDRVLIGHNLGQDIPSVPGNRHQLEQVVTNLILNGMQAIREGSYGTVTVTTGLEVATSSVTISVRDDGVGIPPDVMAHLTEPFFSTRIDRGGSGLGLYISNFIVTEHGGRLSFSSEPGRGTTATISIPATGTFSPQPSALSP